MRARTIPLLCCILLAAPPLAAQEASGCERLQALLRGIGDEDPAADVRISASVRARELRFEGEPQVEVRIIGCELPDSLVRVQRRNLPERIEPGVTYRDVEVGVEIRAGLSAECLEAAEGTGLCGEAVDTTAAERSTITPQQTTP